MRKFLLITCLILTSIAAPSKTLYGQPPAGYPIPPPPPNPNYFYPPPSPNPNYAPPGYPNYNPPPSTNNPKSSNSDMPIQSNRETTEPTPEEIGEMDEPQCLYPYSCPGCYPSAPVCGTLCGVSYLSMGIAILIVAGVAAIILSQGENAHAH